jgi:hypothetical protein
MSKIAISLLNQALTHTIKLCCDNYINNDDMETLGVMQQNPQKIASIVNICNIFTKNNNRDDFRI